MRDVCETDVDQWPYMGSILSGVTHYAEVSRAELLFDTVPVVLIIRIRISIKIRITITIIKTSY